MCVLSKNLNFILFTYLFLNISVSFLSLLYNKIKYRIKLDSKDIHIYRKRKKFDLHHCLLSKDLCNSSAYT